ncbi:protein kinase [Cystobacter fuscus]|uniref:Protein kinase n=1 Tax=Cystobacter fuscus TaxID=43 RepID=A0A250IT36_9BACT|nr:protein kinase [Cystobacter fuscus]ATB34909.1 protein kinase [Cystobacter fuscus]
MSNTSPREGSRLGPYLLDRRHPDSDPALGHIYEAHHVETGAPALVLVPNASTRAPRTAWTVRSRSEVSPPYFAVEVESSPGASTRALHELTLLYIGLSGAMASVEDREDTAAFLSRAPRSTPRPSPRRRALTVGLVTLGGLALGMGMMLLWLRTSAPMEATLGEQEGITVSGEAVNWATLTASTGSTTIGYPLPPAPLKGQHKPPCTEETEVEINGGCWVTLERRAPCGRGYAEYQGKCYMPVKDPPPEPRSIQP